MRVVVFGATGYIGGRLVPELLAAGHRVRVLARSPDRLAEVPWRGDVEVMAGDVTDPDSVAAALSGQEVLYYLVHSLNRQDFVAVDRRAARIVAAAAGAAGLSRMVYLGGITPAGHQLSPHLSSRAEVGAILRACGVPTAELRAAVILGSGSASFEMLRYLTERLPAMITPRWVRNRIQPIAVRDVLYYLVRAAALPAHVNRTFDIGGPDVLTYLDMMRKYAVIARLPRRVIVPVPVLSPWLSAQWVNLVTPVPRSIAVPLMESLIHEVICEEHDVADYIADPSRGLTHFERAVELALARIRNADLPSRRSDAATAAAPSDPLPSDPAWSGGSLCQDIRERHIDADPDTVWNVIESTGGDHGWSSFPPAWSVRGWMDTLTGGLGHRLGRGDPHRLHPGQALDWWRVDQLDRPHLLRLRATMRVPGRAWLELSAVADTGGGTRYRQRAIFEPHGLAGHAYWAAIGPLRGIIFDWMARNICGRAEAHAAARQEPP